jgi:hypothetical protein
MSLSAEEERALHEIERHLAQDPQLLAWVNSASSAQAGRSWDPWATAPRRVPEAAPPRPSTSGAARPVPRARARHWALGLTLGMLGLSLLLLMLGVLFDLVWLTIPAFTAPGVWVGVAWLVNRRTAGDV